MNKVACAVFFIFIILALPSFVFSYRLPDTGQITCYNSLGSEIACAGTRQNGAYRINPMNYTDNGDGTVTDNVTGLMWQKCSFGQNDLNCTGDALTYSWIDAKSVCESKTLGNPGYSDWRLPTKKELISLVDYGVAYPGPVIDEVFANAVPGKYWTVTEKIGDTTIAWQVYFDDGGADLAPKTEANYVRCVRGDMTSPSFTDNGNTVRDNNTGLIWQKGEPGQMQWETAVAYCASLTLDNHSDWRLPNIKELEYLASETARNPAISAIFSGAQPSKYWSSTTEALWLTSAWSLDFLDGIVDSVYNDKSVSRYARCVRAGGECSTDPVKVGGAMYGSVQSAYISSVSMDSILLQSQLILMEDLVFAEAKTVYILGGYDCAFSARSGLSYLYGSMTIRGSGRVIIDGIAIK